MDSYIIANFGTLFSASDLPPFVAAGWLTQEQADTLVQRLQHPTHNALFD